MPRYAAAHPHRLSRMQHPGGYLGTQTTLTSHTHDPHPSLHQIDWTALYEHLGGYRVTQEQHTDIEYSKISTLNIAEDISFLWFFPQK